jgi:hypothetical protein
MSSSTDSDRDPVEALAESFLDRYRRGELFGTPPIGDVKLPTGS